MVKYQLKERSIFTLSGLKYSACLAFVLLVVSSLSAQDFHFDHLDVDQGLSHNTVYAIAEDKDGFIWFGTRDGLNRYDGYYCRKFIIKGPSVSDNNIQSLLAVETGDLWVGLRSGGIAILDRASLEFSLNPFDDDHSIPWKDVSVISLFQDTQKDIWVGTAGHGVFRIHHQTYALEHFAVNADLKSNRLLNGICFGFAEDSDSNIWMGMAWNVLHCYERSENKIISILGDGSDVPDFYSYRKSIHIHNDTIWLASEGNGLYLFDIENFSFFKKSLDGLLVRDIKTYAENKIVVTTDGDGLFSFDSRGKEISNHRFNADSKTSLNTNALYTIYIDRVGNIWLGSFNGGVNLYKRNKAKFYTFFQSSGIHTSIGDRSVLCFAETGDGQIWIGTDGNGISILDSSYTVLGKLESNGNSNPSLCSDVITCMYSDPKENIWIGTFANGLMKITNRGNIECYVHDESDPKSISNNNVWSIREDSLGFLWVGTLGGGLNRFDPKNKIFHRYIPDTTRKGQISDWNILSIMIDSRSRVWIGTEFGGLNRYDPTMDGFISYAYDPKDSSSISSNTITCMFEDDLNNIWIGTEGGALCRFNEAANNFSRFGSEIGFTSKVINSIEGDTERLWISTNSGISAFNAAENTLVNFEKNDGLQSNLFNARASVKLKNGTMMFGGIKGVTSFVPAEIKTNKSLSKTVITDFKVSNQSIQNNPKFFHSSKIISVNDRPEITLTAADKIFTIEFAGLEFTNPENHMYAYKLDGFDEDWQKVDASNRTVSYTSLDDGKYTFRIKSSNNNDQWSPVEKAIDIRIFPPFWDSWWFKSLSIALLISLIIGILRWRDQRKKELHQQELLSAEKQILVLKNEKLAQTVDFKNSQLSAALVQAAHKNESLESLKSLLSKLTEQSKNTGSLDNKAIHGIFRKIDNELDSEDYWSLFQVNFDQVHHRFSSVLAELYPKLSSNDLRVCSLVRIGLANREIAQIQNVSIGAIEKSKYRIKKKMKLAESIDLSHYLLTFDPEAAEL